MSGPHEVVFEHRRVSDSCVKLKGVYRLDREASRVILSEAITLLVRSAFVNSSYRSFCEEAQKLSTFPSSI